MKRPKCMLTFGDLYAAGLRHLRDAEVYIEDTLRERHAGHKHADTVASLAQFSCCDALKFFTATLREGKSMFVFR